MSGWREPLWPDGQMGWSLGRALWLGCAGAEALFEIAWARIILRQAAAGGIPVLNARSASDGRGPADCTAADQAAIARIGWIVPRVSARVPWRSDCLVQAIAAQRLLSRRNLAGRIVLGIENEAESGFGAHAWLAFGDSIVTGGEVARYTILLGEGSHGDGLNEAKQTH